MPDARIKIEISGPPVFYMNAAKGEIKVVAGLKQMILKKSVVAKVA